MRFLKIIYYKYLLWQYSVKAKYYDELTGGQSTYYPEKIKEIKNKLKECCI